MKEVIYVVYDKYDKAVGMYLSRTWSEAMANKRNGSKVVTYRISKEDE